MNTIASSRISSVATATFRRTFLVLETFIAVGGLSGVIQLWFGTAAPPVSDLSPLGLHDWRLPAVWLFASVALPATIAAFAALRRRSWCPAAVIVASLLLLVEVTVQIPFVGPSALQVVFGGLALALLALGLVARNRRTWLPSGQAVYHR